MFFCLPESAREEVSRTEALLQKHNPWPRVELAKLVDVALAAPEGPRRFADFRRMVLDIEGFVQDSRWAIANGLLILRAFPTVGAPMSKNFENLGVSPRVHLLLSDLIVGRERVIFEDLLEPGPGGKRVGAWMIRILADHTVISSLAVLDRLAHLLLLAANVKAPRNRMYFRSGKLELLRDKHAVPISQSLIELAKSEDFSLLLEYRDGFAHTMRLDTSALGSALVDHYLDDAGDVQTIRTANWSSEELLGISLMSFELVRTALWEIGEHCEALLRPQDQTGPDSER